MIAQLVFTLYAPLGSFGAPSLSAANKALKPTDLEPPRSALVGLLGAALGIPRTGLAELAAPLRFAVRVGAVPVRQPQADYHTITPAGPLPGRDRWTRFDELRRHLAGNGTGGSIQSWREYWSDGLWTVAVADVSAVEDRLRSIARALNRPAWPLYAGRKSCALGLAPDPEIVSEPDPVRAHAAYGWPWTRHAALAPWCGSWRQRVEQCRTVLHLCDPDYPGLPEPDRLRIRRDDPMPATEPSGRVLRRFRERQEAWIYTVAEPAGDARDMA